MKWLFLLPCVFALGCSEPRHPDRDQCYLDADSRALREYLDKCSAYENTRDCPDGDAIEARHEKAQEDCP